MGTGVAAFASAFGLYLLAHRVGRWALLAGIVLALPANALALTTLQAIATAR